MTDNILFQQDDTKTIATDEIAGVHYQILKLAFGTLDTLSLVSGTNPMPVSAPNTNIAATGNVTVTSAATQIRGANANRTSLLIQNLGSSSIYWGHSDAVTTGTGVQLVGGATERIDPRYYGFIYAILVSGSADIRYFEVG